MPGPLPHVSILLVIGMKCCVAESDRHSCILSVRADRRNSGVLASSRTFAASRNPERLERASARDGDIV